MISTGTWVLRGLATLAALACAQDTGTTVVFPSHGNGSSLELGSKIERPSFLSDATRNPVAIAAHPMLLPPEYYLPAPRDPTRHRSEILPYAFDYPPPPPPPPPPAPVAAYPVVSHGAEHSIGGPSSKHIAIASFIGLLLLFAIIQNTIIAAKRKDALIDGLPSRRKRELASYDLSAVNGEAEDILNDDARVRCIQRTICLENQKLSRDLGIVGTLLAEYLTRSVERSLKSVSGWDRLVEDAGAAGTRGENCNLIYRDCNSPLASKTQKRLRERSAMAKNQYREKR